MYTRSSHIKEVNGKMTGANDKQYIADCKELMFLWNWKKNNELGLNPKLLRCGSHKEAWWVCEHNHTWSTPIYNISDGRRCPYCAGKRVWVGFNDLQTTNPELVSEWNYERNTFNPTEITSGSKKKVWWKCQFGHEWETQIYNRANGRKCPICAKELNTSFPEQAIFYYMNKVTIAENRNKDWGREIDIYLPKYKIGIEYNGEYYHREKNADDIDKINYFKQKGIRIISIYESDRNYMNGDRIEYIYENISKGSLDYVIYNIFNIIGLYYSPINVHSNRIEIWNSYINLKKANSLLYKYPAIAEEWNYQRNGNLKPEQFAPKSGKKVWWKCKNCEYEWEAAINSRTNNGNGCSLCNGGVSKMVYCPELKQIFISQGEAERHTGTQQAHISSCCRGVRKTAGKHPVTGERLRWYFVYDQTQKDGLVIVGAVTLGFISQEDINILLIK